MAYGAILGQTPPKPVDTIALGNMNAVTSNAVYEAFANLPAGVQIATGSYVGTGTYGSSNPNSLTFEFQPKILFIGYLNGGGNNGSIIIISDGNNSSIVSDASSTNQLGYGIDVSIDINTISWWSTSSATNQGNLSTGNYFYLAIG